MQAFLRVNRTMPFPLDINGILPEVSRTQQDVDQADSELALSAGQIKHAQFWFINKTPIDNVAFNHLLSGNLDSAIEFWKRAANMYSLQNLFVCHLIKEDYKTAIADYAIPLYNQYFKVFVAEFDENASITTTELIENIIETITDEGVDITYLLRYISDPAWKGLIESKKITPLLNQLNSHISEAKNTKEKGPAARLAAGNKLKIASKPLLQTLSSLMSTSDSRYQIIADKVAQEVLQCGIDYYNDTQDLDSPAKSLPLCDYARGIAEGNAAKQRCNENYDIIKKAYDNMPPMEVVNEAKEINDLFVWFRKQSETSSNGLQLLKKAQKPLINIKEKIGKNHKYYLETSSALGSAALGYVIEEVNEAQKEDLPNPLSGLFGRSSRYGLYEDIFGEQERRRKKAYTLKAALRSAWQTILYIDLLDTTSEFKSKRYTQNRETLCSIIDGLKGFDYPDDNYIIKGCAKDLSADRKFFWCDSEHYEACSSKSDYVTYLQKFPNGNHVKEANQRIEEITIQNKKTTKIVLIIIAIIILGIVIICSANASPVKAPINLLLPQNPIIISSQP